ncbi:CCAAT/enhancer-binding protein gamma-like isoform X2 [Acanthaster planci]|uniref:CCAAT/enhancer-binding protein gamma-like isoform X2 n=1 Tax=Acanthaster planci TaxID=133434 RepID=A0A8B8A0H9_ACAPL|nr:CCAAT/enhancer-binding protein gamma-like isoform X2 [Acanthaster planci]
MLLSLGQTMEMNNTNNNKEIPPDNRKPGGGKLNTTGRSLKKYLHDKDSEEYKIRRQRNNIAVRKSRDRSRKKAEETQERVQQLKEENQQLENKVMLLSKELSLLKDLFLAHAREVPDPSTTFGLYTASPDVASRLQNREVNPDGQPTEDQLSSTSSDHTYVVTVNPEGVKTEA